VPGAAGVGVVRVIAPTPPAEQQVDIPLRYFATVGMVAGSTDSRPSYI
jgi:hypothetical protein